MGVTRPDFFDHLIVQLGPLLRWRAVASGHGARLARMSADATPVPALDVYDMSFGTVKRCMSTRWRRRGEPSEVDAVVRWLTGYTQRQVTATLERRPPQRFFGDAPALNPNRALITGVVCGVRVEEVEDPVLRNVRYLDKLIDELAKGKPMDTVLRNPD